MDESIVSDTDLSPKPNLTPQPPSRASSISHDSKLFMAQTEDSDPEKAGLTADTGAVGAGGVKDPNIVDWDGPDDPEKPVNWHAAKKWTNVMLVAALTLLTPFGSSMFAPAVPQVMQEFHSANVDLATFVVSVYLLGYACGPLVIAPMSELYGRLPAYHICTLLFLLFNVVCAKSTGLVMLVVFRFLAGVAGSCPLTVGSGTIADLFRQEERGRVMSVWTLPVLFGPTLGPVVGGYLSDSLGWRWDFWFLVIATAVIFLLSLTFQRETYPPILLERKVHGLRKKTGNTAIRSIYQSPKDTRDLLVVSLVWPMKMLFLSPIIFGLSLYVAIGYGYLYLVFTTMTEVFEGQYGISRGNVGLTYLGIGVGNFTGLIAFGFISDSLMKRMAKKNGGEMKPEYRLPPLIPGGLLLPIGLLWYGWTAEYKVHWIVPIIGTVFIGMGMITMFMPIGTYLIDAFTTYAASAMAANTVLRSVGGAFLPLCGRRMYDTLGLGWGNSLLALIALGLVPVMWMFIKYGEQIRKHPRFQLNL